MTYKYFANCTDWPRHKVNDLIDMIDAAKQITRQTFLKHVDKFDLIYLEESLGYSKHHKQGLTMAQDYCVGYYKSKYNEKTVYFLNQSAIEFVFTAEPLFSRMEFS